MPITYTGRSVKPSSHVHPSLTDIAVGLSRQPRFAGQGQRWFSVLDHSLFADELVKGAALVEIPYLDKVYDLEESKRLWRLAVLLHDAHEAVTGDVPTTFKGHELKEAQRRLDERIGDAFYPRGGEYFLHPTLVSAVKWIDRRALHAEARVVGPPAAPERILEAFGISDQTHDDVTLLENMIIDGGTIMREGPRWFAIPPTAHTPAQHPGVQEYLRRLLELM